MFKPFALALLIPVMAAISLSQAAPVPSAQPQSSVEGGQNGAPDSPTLTIKVRSNLVQVRVVVRDANDKPVTDLKQEDFQIYDEHQLQKIRTFAVETPESRSQKIAPPPQAEVAGSSGPNPVELPDRFVALVFDDANLSSRDTVTIKKAADLFLRRATGNDRIGIYSTSGQVTQEFTSDTNALHRALMGVVPRSREVTNDRQCPNVSYNLARQIEEYHDQEAAAVVINETLRCAFGGDPMMIDAARSVAQSAIHQALRIGEDATTQGLSHLEGIVRRLAQMPGQRVLVLLSPGFLNMQQASEQWQIIDRANQANIVINTLDVRGLDVPDAGEDMTKRSTDLLETRDQKVQARLNKQLEQSSVLAGFAYGTGGSFFHNSNDLLQGLRLAASPEICYVLGFVPRDLAQDGRYHTLDVKLTGSGREKYSLQARRGYYAPEKLDPKEQVDREIADALHSREEAGNLFLGLQASSFALGKGQGNVLVTSRVAVNNIRFKDAEGKHSNVLRMITAIFDENGNVVAGGEKGLAMDLTDGQYRQLLQAGLTVNSSFDLKPGRYLVRQLIRDTASEETSARNQAIEVTK